MATSGRNALSSREVPAGRLLICRRCRLLKGPVPGRTDGVRQLCVCTPVEVRRAQPRWGGDHNTYAELCRCCGLVLLPSGSKWSVWFCDQCKEAVVALNRSAGRCLIPIGRHSLMNGVAARPAQLRSEVAAVAFADQLMTFFGSISGIETWASTIVKRNLAALGFDTKKDARLADYLDAVDSSSLSPTSAFEALVSSAAGRKHLTMRPGAAQFAVLPAIDTWHASCGRSHRAVVPQKQRPIR